MPRSFLVKKAKYANDYGNSSSSKQQQQHSFYRQPSPTEGETAPNAVHHYSTSITTNRFSYGKFAFSFFLVQLFFGVIISSLQRNDLPRSCLCCCSSLVLLSITFLLTESLHLNYSIELVEMKRKVWKRRFRDALLQ